MCGRAKCGQLNLAHLTETARYRYICYSSVDHSSGVLVGLVHSSSSVKRTVKALLKRRQCPASQDIFVVVTRRRGHGTFKRIITVRTIKSPVKASSWRNYHCPSTRIHSNIRRVRRSQACQTLLCESQLQCLLCNYQTEKWFSARKCSTVSEMQKDEHRSLMNTLAAYKLNRWIWKQSDKSKKSREIQIERVTKIQQTQVQIKYKNSDKLQKWIFWVN